MIDFSVLEQGKIHTIIDETPFISDLQRTFYKTILSVRKDRILNFSLQRLNEKEQTLMHNEASIAEEKDLFEVKLRNANERSKTNKTGSFSPLPDLEH